LLIDGKTERQIATGMVDFEMVRVSGIHGYSLAASFVPPSNHVAEDGYLVAVPLSRHFHFDHFGL
jgi:hypothetical protein